MTAAPITPMTDAEFDRFDRRLAADRSPEGQARYNDWWERSEALREEAHKRRSSKRDFDALPAKLTALAVEFGFSR